MKEGWEYKKLGDVCKVIGGGTPDKKNPSYYNGNILWATVRDMNVDYLETTEFKITKDGLDNSSSNIIPAGEIVIATRVGLGKVCLLKSDTAINQDLKGVVPIKKDTINRKYLFYWFKSISDFIVKNGVGATVQGVKLTFVNNITFPFPPLSEQQRIVEYLDSSFAKIDAMKANAEKALNEAKALFQASLKSLLEPKEGWEEKTILDVVDENSSISYGIVQPGDDVPNGIPVVRPVDLTCKIITLTNQIKRTTKENSDAYKRTILNGKEILLCVRGTTGIISLTDESLKGCNVTRGLVPLRVNGNTLRNFLYYALLAPVASAFIQHNTRGAALKQINIADVKLIPISLPSSVEQQRIVATLDTLKSKVDLLQSNFDKISKECDALKQALLKQVFE